MLKKHLYSKLKSIRVENPHTQQLIDEIVEELEQGLEIQESSQELMSSMIKDLLDYAQIRAGKFRKNITTFDIRKSIEKVMAISRLNVKNKGLDFEVEYLNLS